MNTERISSALERLADAAEKRNEIHLRSVEDAEKQSLRHEQGNAELRAQMEARDKTRERMDAIQNILATWAAVHDRDGLAAAERAILAIMEVFSPESVAVAGGKAAP